MTLKKCTRLGVALLIALFLLVCGWRSADDFEALLKCGMTVTDVQATATGLGAGGFRVLPNGESVYNYGLVEGRTHYSFQFKSGELIAYRRSRQVGFTGMEAGPRVDLCSNVVAGGVSVIVRVSGSWTSAILTIDGSRHIPLPSRPGEFYVRLDPGIHKLAFTSKSGEILERSIEANPEVTEVRVTLPPD